MSLQSDGLELWEEPLVFIIHHLEAVLRQKPRGLSGRPGSGETCWKAGQRVKQIRLLS